MNLFCIIGAERSGTSYLASLLGGHERHISPPECQFKRSVLEDRFLKAELSEDEVRSMWKLVQNHFRYQLWELTLDIEDYLQTFSSHDIKGFFAWIVQAYALEKHGKEEVDAWFDHDPGSGSYYDGILKAFPDARFIHLIRDGRAVHASFKKVDWGPSTPKAGAFYWKEGVEMGSRVEEALGSDRCLRIYYEELIEDPELVLKRICEWGELEFRKEMLAGKGFIPPDYTRAQHRYVRDAPRKERKEGWRNVLSNREVELFEYFAGQTLSELGYERSFSDPRSMSFLEKIWYGGKERLLNRWNAKVRKRRKVWGSRKAEEAKKAGH